ncbi:MAG: roadblock/LC7 domain-containing protein [Terriglobales bacterium]
MTPPPSVADQAMQPGGGGLFSIDDSVIDRIFADNLGVKEQGMPAINVNEAVRTLAEVAQTGPVPPPNIEGVGRLDPRTDSGQETGSGRIASIGKFLLDQKDLEKIGKVTTSDLSDTKMRILTMEAAQELQTLLQHIGAQETVVGSVIVGHDGLLIANTMPGDLDAESIGVWALGVYMNTEHVIKKMGQDRVHQIVSRTPKGYLVIADFGCGLLVTVSDGKDTDTLIPLMRSITQLVAQ